MAAAPPHLHGAAAKFFVWHCGGGGSGVFTLNLKLGSHLHWKSVGDIFRVKIIYRLGI